MPTGAGPMFEGVFIGGGGLTFGIALGTTGGAGGGRNAGGMRLGGTGGLRFGKGTLRRFCITCGFNGAPPSGFIRLSSGLYFSGGVTLAGSPINQLASSVP